MNKRSRRAGCTPQRAQLNAILQYEWRRLTVHHVWAHRTLEQRDLGVWLRAVGCTYVSLEPCVRSCRGTVGAEGIEGEGGGERGRYRRSDEERKREGGG